jgi:hypothetical protein
MSSTISEKQREEIDKILQFGSPDSKSVGALTPSSRPDPNSKTVTTALLQGGILTVSKRSKPVRKLSFTEELDKILSFGTDRY